MSQCVRMCPVLAGLEVEVKVPKYRKHSSRDTAFVEFRGERIYLPGAYNSAESRASYKQFLADNLDRQPADNMNRQPDGLMTIARILRLFIESSSHRNESTERSLKNAVRLLADHLDMPVSKFTPKVFRRHLMSLVEKRLSKGYINLQYGWIKRIWRWAASEELISPSEYHAIASVLPVRVGDGPGIARSPRQPVDWNDLKDTLPGLSKNVRAMVELQCLTGVRSASICAARAEQFDTSGELWVWTPRHKTEHLGHKLTVLIGPRAQEILRPFIGSKGYLFSPDKTRRNLRFRKHYSSSSYRNCIRMAIIKLNKKRQKRIDAGEKISLIKHWYPHQIRHAVATLVQSKYSLEAAKAVLGHHSVSMTQVYAHRDLDLARRVALDIG